MDSLKARLAACVGATCLALCGATAAHAFNGPTPIAINIGSLGSLQLSGGVDGFGYFTSGTAPGSLDGKESTGVEFMNGLIEVQKTDGLVQGTLIIGSTNNYVLGYAPHATSIQTFSTGPVYDAYLTLAPSPHFNISAGHVGSLEGYESGIDWNNFNILTTDMFEVENSQSMGVSATVTFGPVSGTVTFGDGWDTQLWNYLQLSATYTFNSNNVLTAYGATNLSTTGPNALFYGSSTTPYNKSTVGFGPYSGAPFANSSEAGAYYSFTAGNLNVVPEVQYTWATKTPVAGLTSFSSNFGAAVFADYQFDKTPYSLGGWVQYFTSSGPDDWFLNPGAQGFGLSVTPTWQGKYLFVRGDLGFLHLTQISNTAGFTGYSSSLTGRNVGTFLLEAGILF